MMVRNAITAVLFFYATSAQAGFFDDVLNKAKEVTEETVKKTVETVAGSDPDEPAKTQEPAGPQQKPAPATTTQQAAPAKPAYDKQQVREIQQRLKDLGYPIGVVDGLYGQGTRSAILAYQKDAGIPADGLATEKLLARLNASNGTTTTAQPSSETSSNPPSAAGDNAALPTSASIERAVLSYHPDVLNYEPRLKEAVSRIYPAEWQEVAHDEFAWQKRKSAFKSRILAEISDPPVTFTAAPWLRKASAGRMVLGQYDFKQKAFAVRGSFVSIPVMGYDARPIIRDLGLSKISSLSMPPQQAETLAKSPSFVSQKRTLYAGLSFTITGARKYQSHGETKVFPRVSLNQIDLFRVTGKSNQTYDRKNYQYVTSIQLQSPASDTAQKDNQPAYSIPDGVTLLEGEALKETLLGNTVAGSNWAAYFDPGNTVETLWQRQPDSASFSIDGPLICFDKANKIATTECIAVSRTEDNRVRFYELYGGKKLIPYRLAPGPFTRTAEVIEGRAARLIDPDGHAAIAEADILGIRLGMSLQEVDQQVRQYRGDMKRIRFDGRRKGKDSPWAPGLQHVRYESPDGKEVIGVQFESPEAGDHATLAWRTIEYEIGAGAPRQEAMVDALIDKYGGQKPPESKYSSMALLSWANNGAGLKSSMNCQARPNSLAHPLSYVPGPLNHIDTKCGESVTAELKNRDGFVTRLRLFLVNQAMLDDAIERNRRHHLENSAAEAPRL
ncbi:MAG: peptidoglycan-binding protein [Sedimenticola sp.]|nr:peptidoglycan-binding protein [Sedimenticola sp.]